MRLGTLRTTSFSGCKQRGVVLVVALVLLLTLTIIAVGSMGTSNLEQKMSANMRDRQVAFQAAEAALREGERHVQNNSLPESSFSNACTNGLCLCTRTMVPACGEYWTDTNLNVWTTAGKYRTYAGTQLGAQPARYIIEYRGQLCGDGTVIGCTPTAGDPIMYRITAVGYGQSTAASVMLQSTYLKE